MKFMSDTSLSELVAKIKEGFFPIKTVSTDTGAQNADLDEYKANGIYIITGDGADVQPGSSRYGYLFVLKHSAANIAQLWIDRNPDSWYSDYPIFCRRYNGAFGTWTSWVQFPSVRDWDTLRTSISGKLDSSDFTLSNITGTLSIEKGGTGATDKFSAITNLAYNIVSGGPPYTKDLNYYTAQTISCFTSVAATSHIPTGSNGVGMLVVITPDRNDLYQIWIELSSNTTDTFIRTRISNTWSNWEKITNANELQTALSGKLDASDFTLANITGTLPVNKGGTGATTASGALSNLGITTTEYTPTELNNCTVTACKVYKTLDRVYLEGYISVLPTSTSAHYIQAAQLPSECYPPANTRGMAYTKESSNIVSPIALEVTTAGKVVLTGIVGVQSGSSYARQNIYFSTSYRVDN